MSQTEVEISLRSASDVDDDVDDGLWLVPPTGRSVWMSDTPLIMRLIHLASSCLGSWVMISALA